MHEIVISTSRHVTPPVRRLARELSYTLWSAKRVNRGSSNFEELVTRSRALGARRLIIIGRGLHGNPGRISFFDISTAETRPLLTLVLRGVIFPERLRSIKKPTTPILVASVGRCLEPTGVYAEDLAYALNSSYIGCLSVNDFKNFKETRVLVVEYVQSTRFVFVIKFIENSQELGLKILVRSVKIYH